MRKRRHSSQRRQSEKEEAPPKRTMAKLTEVEDAGSGAVGFGVYIRYFQSVGIAMTVWAIISNVINSGMSIYSSSK